MEAPDFQESVEILRGYSACDISDVLLKLQQPMSDKVYHAGFLADIKLFAPSSLPLDRMEALPKIIAPASTLKLEAKNSGDAPLRHSDPGSVPDGTHWVDLTDPGTMVMVEQPPGQSCAAIGGIMATRMRIRGVQGCIVSGRVRDMAELNKSGLPIWARGTSTVGSGAETKVYARNVVVSICGNRVWPGDIVFCDPLEGVVVIPKDLLGAVVGLLPDVVAADERVKEDVEKGMSVYEAFKKHRQ